MSHKFIAPNRKKQVWIIGILSVILLGWGWILWHQYQEKRVIHSVIATFLILLLVFLSYDIGEILITPEKRGVLLDDEGILFQQTSLGRMVGKVARKNITAIHIKEEKHMKYIVIYFKSPSFQYPNIFWLWECWSDKLPLGGLLPMPTDELEITLDELWQWIHSYWNQYS